MKKFASLAAGALLTIYSNFVLADGLQSATLNVKGMTCSTCPITVKQVLKKVSGVSDVVVDLRTETASVKFDPERTKPALLAKAVTDFGFPTTVKK